MRIGIFGGSFDPIHNAHLMIATAALEELQLAQVRIVVAAESPHKKGKTVAGAEHRFRMVELALRGSTRLIADRRELDRGGPSYTVDTIRSLRNEFSDAELVLLLGSDSAHGFLAWREPEVIRQMAKVAICARAGEAIPEGFEQRWAVPSLDVSSAQIRTRASTGKSLLGWVPESVADYITGLRLYGGSAG